MNQKGNMILLILLGFAAIILLLPGIMYFFKPADLIIRIILVFLIFSTVRSFLGNGVLSLVVTGILIYFLVIKHAYFAASAAFVLLVLLSYSVFSVIVWGIGMNMRRG